MPSRDLFILPDQQALVTDLVTRNPGNLLPLFEGDTDNLYSIYAPAGSDFFESAVAILAVSVPEDGTGENRASAGTQRVIYKEPITAGPLVVGKWYFIALYIGSDSFTNVGGVNATGSLFLATGTTPTTWTEESILWQVSAEFAFDASAAIVQAAVRYMRADFAAFTAVGDDFGPWQLLAPNYTAFYAFTIFVENLYPQCLDLSSEIVSGDGLSKAQVTRLNSKWAACAQAVGTSIDPGEVSVDVIEAGGVGVSTVVDLILTGAAHNGQMIPSVGGVDGTVVSFNPTAAQLAAAFAAIAGIGDGNVSVVIKDSSFTYTRYRITFSPDLGAVADVDVDGSGVIFGVGRRFALSCDTYNMAAALQNRPDRNLVMELQLNSDSSISTALSAPQRVINDSIDNDPGSPLTPPAPAPTSGEVLVWLSGVTSETGSGAASLDYAPTVGVTVTRIVAFYNSSASENQTWKLRSGTDANVAGSIRRPLDYNASTNAVVYERFSFV